MSLINIVSDIGIGVIKNTAKTLYGGAKTVIGHISDDPDMIEDGMKTLGKGVIGIGKSLLIKEVMSSDSNDGDGDAGGDGGE